MSKGLLGITSALLVASLAACATAPVERVAPQTEANIDVAPNGPTWEVNYTLPRQVAELRFARVDHHGTRARDWTPLEPGFELVATPDGEVVRRRDGATFSQVGFSMKPRYVPLEKDYAPFSPFGDGGLLIHSGRLHACAERCEDGVEHSWRVRITPPAGAHAIVGGLVVATGDFVETQPGTNVYVGHARPLDTPDVVAVVDAAMPAGTRDRLATLLPRLMNLYGDEFGRLPSRPMLYASRDEQYPSGYGYQGGTLPGQVFVHVYGQNDAFATDKFADRMDSFFAHEAAHLYQRNPSLSEPGDAWIHEGGAEAMGLLALVRLGEIDPKTVRQRVDEAVANCAEGIGEAPMLPLPSSGRFELTYACGLVVQMAVEASARSTTGKPCDLFCVWREYQHRVDGGAPWTTATFAQVVADRVDVDTARFVREAVTTSPVDPNAFLRAGLE